MFRKGLGHKVNGRSLIMTPEYLEQVNCTLTDGPCLWPTPFASRWHPRRRPCTEVEEDEEVMLVDVHEPSAFS